MMLLVPIRALSLFSTEAQYQEPVQYPFRDWDVVNSRLFDQNSIIPQPCTFGKPKQGLRFYPEVLGLYTVRPKTERSPDMCRK